ncbi:MAG: PEP/pyruvate-binding domain-containing protein [Chloroflexi bacterium]|nr:PEP/pyruvate-binding domain-containing protein [Chloroflexota bacterium]
MQAADRPRFVEWLGASEAPAQDWDVLLGGKGASLERLLRMGAPTPPGFCLTTEAFRHHLQTGSHATEASAAISALPAHHARQTLTRLLTGAPIPDRLAVDLNTGLERLAVAHGGTKARFAVRSSALGEDGGAASFAGIHETELQLAPGEVPPAIRRCWASLWSDRALEYRVARGLPMDGAMAVVVQVLIPADAAAVVFTRHPVTRRGDQMLVNAVCGLGEALVSGTVTPDEIVVDKATLRTTAFVPGQAETVLDDQQLRELVVISLGLEEKFGRPIDIEAAHAGGQWHILQARPITV